MRAHIPDIRFAMPYFVFKIKPSPGQIVKQLDLERECASFQEAKALVRQLREAQPDAQIDNVRMIFAKDRIEAEELLNTPREKPVLLEWEK